MLIGLLVALVAMALNSLGALLQADGARRATRSRPVAVQPRYLGGIVVDFLAWLCAVVALRTLPVFAVQAIIGGSIAITAVVGSRVNGTVLDRTTRIAVAVCLAGLVLVAASAGSGHPPVTSALVNYVLIGSFLILAVLVLVLRQYRRAWPLAVTAGMGFGGTALAVRAAHVEIGDGFSLPDLLAQPAVYLVAGFWAIGMVGYSAALARGDVGVVTAVFIVTEVVLPGVVGIVLLGDPVRAGWGWPFVIGLTVAVVGVVVLARRPHPGGGARDESLPSKTPAAAARQDGRMPSWDDVVDIAVALPHTEISTSYGTPALKVKGKGFARLRTEAEGGLMIRCTAAEKEALLASGDPAFFTTPHYDGYASILVDLTKIDLEHLRELVVEAWRDRAPVRVRQAWDADRAGPPATPC